LKITKERYFTKCDYPRIWVKQIRERRLYSYEECVKFIDLLGIKKQERVLEVGTGEGRLIPLVTRKGGQYVGIDVSKDMFEYARDSIKACSADFVLCEAKSLPFREKVFGKCFCYATMFFIPNQERAIKEIVRVCEAKVLVELRNLFNPHIFEFWLFDNKLKIQNQPYFPLTPFKILRILRGLSLKSFMVSFFDHGQIVNGKKWFFKPFLIVEARI
jgi:SAM-dependent methyltransferase